MNFKRGTTPSFTISSWEEMKLSDYIKIRVIFSQKKNIIVKEFIENDIVKNGEDERISFILTQEETFSFKPGQCRIEIRVLNSDGIVKAGEIGIVNIIETADTEIMQEG